LTKRGATGGIPAPETNKTRGKARIPTPNFHLKLIQELY